MSGLPANRWLLNKAVMTSGVASCAFDRSCPIEVSGCTWSAAEATFPILERASLSAACFHRLSSPSVNLASSFSTRLPQLWQSQIALSACLRSPGVSAGAYLGPPGDAAVIWAATPMLIAFVESAFGPVVCQRHDGFEQRLLTRAAITLFTSLLKSSRMANCPTTCFELGCRFNYFLLNSPPPTSKSY